MSTNSPTRERSGVSDSIGASLRSCCPWRPGPPPANPQAKSSPSLQQIWDLPRDARDSERRIRFEATIYYFDREWNVVWGECAGKPTVLPMGNAPITLHQGDRILLDGVIIPSQQRFLWDKTRIDILEHDSTLAPQPIPNLIDQPAAWSKRLISVEGLVDQGPGRGNLPGT